MKDQNVHVCSVLPVARNIVVQLILGPILILEVGLYGVARFLAMMFLTFGWMILTLILEARLHIVVRFILFKMFPILEIAWRQT